MSALHPRVVIVGSGFGAAAPALRLARAGAEVVVLEKGPHIDPRDGFRQTQDPTYFRRYLKSVSGRHLNLTYTEALGGGSGFYEMVSLRAPGKAFEQKDAAGHRLWPAWLDRRALDPYYEQAESMLKVEQIAPEDVPRTGLVFSLMMKRLGYSCDRARYAVQGCMGDGFCLCGCVYAAKQSLLLNYLPQAVEAGARVETGIEVLRVESRSAGPVGDDVAASHAPPRYEVVARRGDSGELRRYPADVVVLAAGTVGTAVLLERSRHTLHGLSGEVGRNIAFNGSVKVAGLLSDDLPDGDMFSGRSHPGMVSYQFLESHGVMVTAAKVLPLQIVSGARLRRRGSSPLTSWWGQEHEGLMKKIRRRVMVLVAFGLTPPEGRVMLDSSGRPALSLQPSRALRDYLAGTRRLLESILTRNGCQVLETDFVTTEGAPVKEPWFSSTHHVGSARMADSPRRGVVDPSGQVFGNPGLYVSDGAAVPSSLAVNTSLTILANAERIAAGMVARLGLSSPEAHVAAG